MSNPIERIEELMKLPVGWDGYQGQPVNKASAAAAAAIYSALVKMGLDNKPSVVPSCDGGLQLEWYDETSIVEVYVLAKKKEKNDE